jgi:hypothetical protein
LMVPTRPATSPAETLKMAGASRPSRHSSTGRKHTRDVQDRRGKNDIENSHPPQLLDTPRTPDQPRRDGRTTR